MLGLKLNHVSKMRPRSRYQRQGQAITFIQILLDVITCPCPWYLLLVHKSSYAFECCMVLYHWPNWWVILFPTVVISYVVFLLFIGEYCSLDTSTADDLNIKHGEVMSHLIILITALSTLLRLVALRTGFSMEQI